MNKPIGVFDSGIGGISILKDLLIELPCEKFIYLADSKNAPYGPLPEKKIIELAEKNIDFLIKKECKIIVIACNTITAAAIKNLRSKYSLPIIGLEPAIKPACLKTKTGAVGVLATQGTFEGEHFKNTSKKYSNYVKLHLQIAKELVDFAEKGDFDSDNVKKIISHYLNNFKNRNIDYIVLGCTHYPFFIKQIKECVGENIQIIDSSEAVTRRTKDILMTYKILNISEFENKLIFYTTGNTEILKKLANNYLNIAPNNYIVEKMN